MTRGELYREIGPFILRASMVAPKNAVTISLADYGYTVYVAFGPTVIGASAVPGGWDHAKAEAAFDHAVSPAGRNGFTWLTDELPPGRWHDAPQAQG